jgi:hypothetical protein
MDALEQFSKDLDRVEEEARKAFGYLVVSRAYRAADDSSKRWNRSPSSLALFYTRQGLHMAFTTTLAATLEDTKGRVSLPRLVGRLKDHHLLQGIAKAHNVPVTVIADQAGRLVRRYDEGIGRTRHHKALRSLRNNVVAHHGRDVASHGATHGALVVLAVRVVTLISAVSQLVKGDSTDTRAILSILRGQANAFWEHGIDGHPDLREDHLEER